MSRMKNIFTGESYMTEMNALRHFYSKANKAYKKYDYDLCMEVYRAASMEIEDLYICDFCNQDDFGYCGLRKSKIPKDEKFMKFCFPSLIESFRERIKFSGGTLVRR